MEDPTLPTEFDVIILGTGMTECILAAAFSRVGYKVLHLDRNEYYSGDWATFHFKSLREWIDGCQKEKLKPCDTVDEAFVLKEGELMIPLNINSCNITNLLEHVYINQKEDDKTTSPDQTQQQIADPGKAKDEAEPETPSTPQEVSEAASSPKDADNDSSTEPRDGGCSVDEETTPKEDSLVSDETSQNEVPVTEDCLPPAPVVPSEPVWTMEKVESKWRKFNIDIMPKILYSRGPMVELLISSDIAKYLEFRAITRILTQFKEQIQQVPCSRADVFSSKQVNMIEKRMLMKLLTFCLDFENHPEEYSSYEEKTFVEFLKSKKLTPNVLHYVLHAIAMATETTPTIEGLEKTQKFLKSLGRYGNTAFLWPMYGSGEIPQCFCRVSAVFGGIYCLRRTGQSVIVDAENVAQGIIDTEGQRLTSKWLIMEASFATADLHSVNLNRKISRAILLTDRSILPDKQEHITLMNLPPPEGSTRPITVYELSSLSMACPEGLYVVHLIGESSSGDATSDFAAAIEKLFECNSDSSESCPDVPSGPPEGSTKPRVLWSVFFNMADTSDNTPKDDIPSNLYVVGGPSADLDMDKSIFQAQSLFEKLCPGEEFLPRAPNPEDIIIDGMEAAGPGFGPDGEENKDDQDWENTSKETVSDSGVSQDGSTTETENQPTEKGSEVEPKDSEVLVDDTKESEE